MPNTTKRVLVTGAFGNIGGETLSVLLQRGHQVVATDRRTKGNLAVEARLRKLGDFTTEWADITDQAQMEQLVQGVAPDCLIHLAALIPPGIYFDAELARKVNLDGTRYLIEAAVGLDAPPLFVLASSHTVHGYRNGARELPPLRADDPRTGCDVYTRLKIECEDLLTASGLPYTILRYGIVFPKVYSTRIDPTEVRMGFLVPLESRSHGVHAEDAGYATARSAEGDAAGKVLMIGGGERWKQRQRYYMENILGAVGVGMLPEEAYLQADPERDESWFYVDWMDTAEGEALLQYQRHEPEDYFRALAKQMGILRPLARLASPLVRRKMARLSPFYKGKADPRAPGMDLDERVRRFALP